VTDPYQTVKSGDQNVERVSFDPGWQRKIISDGVVNEVDGHMYLNGYVTNNHPVLPDNPVDTDTGSDLAGRALPQVHDVTSYPMVSPTGDGHFLVEPIGSFSFAPSGLAQNNKIPNEDSLDLELDSANLFDANRFPGIDRIESGAHVSYGVRSGYFLDSGGYATLLLGQSKRLSGPDIFPSGSGLETPTSDYVGGLDIYPGKYVTLSYQTRLDRDSFASKLHQVNFSFNPDADAPGGSRTTIGGNYLFLASIPGINAGQNRNNITPFISQKIGKYWTFGGSVTTELGSMGRIQEVSTTTTYQDDCMTFTLQASRDLTNSVGGLNGTSVFFRLGLRTLGWVQSPNVL
jgi:LPS-assembly protein